MPITLEKLFSPTLPAAIPFLGETVNVVWAPWRWTAQMQELAESLVEQGQEGEGVLATMRETADVLAADLAELEAAENPDLDAITAAQARLTEARTTVQFKANELDTLSKRGIRDFLERLLVSWDVLDDAGRPLPTDMAVLKSLPDPFLQTVFYSLSAESSPDPTTAPSSDGASSTVPTSDLPPTGSASSPEPAPSASRRSSSTRGRRARAPIQPGSSGR